MRALSKALFTLAIASVLTGTLSCTKSNNSTSSTTPTPTFSATINGSNPGVWTVTGGTNSGLITINGAGAGGVTVGLEISAINTGTYQLGAPGGNAGVYGTSSPGTTSYTTTGTSPYVGTLTITTYNTSTKTISGTFSFTAQENYPNSTGTATITSGSFANVIW
jgi:hypothetical protein